MAGKEWSPCTDRSRRTATGSATQIGKGRSILRSNLGASSPKTTLWAGSFVVPLPNAHARAASWTGTHVPGGIHFPPATGNSGLRGWEHHEHGRDGNGCS